MSARVENLFETPLIVDTLPDAAALNVELATAMRERRDRHPGVRKSNWLGWQSDPDMLEWGGPAAQRLADHCLNLCDRFTALPPGGKPNFVWFVEMWANISGPGASNEAHVHPGAVWSAVYYVDDGRQGAEDPDVGGDLVLYDPRMPASRMLPYDLRYRRSDGSGVNSFHPVPAIAGRIVMFPPWILHSVHPYHGEGERLSIAMNVNAIAS